MTPSPFAIPASILLCLVSIAGCGSKAPAPVSDASNVKAQQWQDVKSKMSTMTPEQRAQYIREHPEEINSLGQVDVPPPMPAAR